MNKFAMAGIKKVLQNKRYGITIHPKRNNPPSSTIIVKRVNIKGKLIKIRIQDDMFEYFFIYLK